MATPNVMYNGGLSQKEIDVLISLERGLVVSIFFYKKKPEKRTLKIKPETRQLIWIKAHGVRPEGTSK